MRTTTIGALVTIDDLEVHPDAYGKASDARTVVMERACSQGYVELLDMTLVEKVIRKRDGVVHDVTRR
jgi:hypothetical protein